VGARSLADDHGLIEPFLALQSNRQVNQGSQTRVQHSGFVGLQFLAQIEIVDRLLVPPEFEEQKPALTCSLEMTRIDLQRVLEGQYCVRRTPRRNQREAEVLPQLRIVGFELYPLVKHPQRFLEPSLRKQSGAEARQVKWLGIAADRLGKPLHGAIILLGVERQESYQVEAFHTVWIHRERLLAAALRVERPASLHMSKARFIESGRGFGTGTV
jgi:hypothetical protein